MKPAPSPLPEAPRLKLGCRFVLHEFEDGASWVLEHPDTGKFFRMGLREEQFARQLDGKRSLMEILTSASEDQGAVGLSQQEMLLFTQSLQTAALLEEAPGKHVSQPPRKPFFNPMFLRVPVLNPDRFFKAMADWVTPIPASPVLTLMAVVFIFGAYAIISDWERFAYTMGSVLSVSNIPAFAACFVLLKLIHETAHGVLCRRFGGHVPEAGLFFVFFIPLTYIDATSSWRFPSKWVRILIASAGMLAELFVAAIAALVWAYTPLGALNTLAANTVVVASVTTILFNANPLMRFDGYYILADVTGRPNLYGLATRSSLAFLGRFLLGLPSSVRSSGWIVLYGLGCILWRTAIIAGICIGAVALLHGFGIILAALTLFATYFPVIRRMKKGLADMKERQVRPSMIRVGILALLVAAFFLVPINPPPASPGVVEAVDRVDVRVQCPGFVVEVGVRSGDMVAKGDLLVRLENWDEKIRLKNLQSERLRAEAMANYYRENGNFHAMAQQREKASALGEQVRETTAYLQTLELRAPNDGRVYARNLESLQGRFATTGTEVLSIASVDRREVRFAVSQAHFDRLRLQAGDPVQVLAVGRFQVVSGLIERVESAATTQIRHEALTASVGGPLAVITRSESGRELRTDEESLQLVEPHFYLAAILAREGKSEDWQLGETVRVRFPLAVRRTLAASMLAGINNFVDRAVERVST